MVFRPGPLRARWPFEGTLALALWALSAPALAQDDAGPSAEADAAAVAPDVAAEPTAPSPTADSELRVAVLLLPTGDVDPATTDALTELLIAAVAGRGSPQIVGKEEIESQLGRDDAGMLECMESVTCLGIAGVELGVREIVSGTLGRRGGSWIFVLERIDVRSGDVSGRVFRVVEGELDRLIVALSDAVPELYVDAVRPGRIVLHARVGGATVALDGEVIGTTEEEAPFRRDLVAPGAHTLEVTSRRHEPWSRDVEIEEGATLVLDATLVPAEHHVEVPVLTWVLGSAALLSLGGGIALGLVSQEDARAGATMRQVDAFYEARIREAIAANVLYVGAGALALGALVPLIVALVEDAEAAEAPALTLVPSLGIGADGPTLGLSAGGLF